MIARAAPSYPMHATRWYSSTCHRCVNSCLSLLMRMLLWKQDFQPNATLAVRVVSRGNMRVSACWLCSPHDTYAVRYLTDSDAVPCAGPPSMRQVRSVHVLLQRIASDVYLPSLSASPLLSQINAANAGNVGGAYASNMGYGMGFRQGAGGYMQSPGPGHRLSGPMNPGYMQAAGGMPSHAHAHRMCGATGGYVMTWTAEAVYPLLYGFLRAAFAYLLAQGTPAKVIQSTPGLACACACNAPAHYFPLHLSSI
jgi:hypothetical protein